MDIDRQVASGSAKSGGPLVGVPIAIKVRSLDAKSVVVNTNAVQK